MLASAVVPLALLFILSACGASKRQTTQPTAGVRGSGFTIEVLQGSIVTHPRGAVAVRSGADLVSVTTFPLVKAYDVGKFDAAAKELDGLAARLAKQAGTTVAKRETVTVAGRRIRAYEYGGRRIGFVLVGKREYQLFCRRAGDACDLLFSSFTLSGPQT
ncbi:MAG TPA: hypothetical protein VGK79_03180 [Gaiellaceae bacterium]